MSPHSGFSEKSQSWRYDEPTFRKIQKYINQSLELSIGMHWEGMARRTAQHVRNLKNTHFPGENEVPRQTQCRAVPGPMKFECIPVESSSDWLMYFWIISHFPHRVFRSGFFSKKPLWGFMFSHEYEYFGFFSENVILRYCEWILLLFLMFCWSLFDDVLTACDDQRTTFACIFHGASMCEISKNLHFPWENELFFSNAAMEKSWTVGAKCVGETSKGDRNSTKSHQRNMKRTWTKHEIWWKKGRRRFVAENAKTLIFPEKQRVLMRASPRAGVGSGRVRGLPT